MAVASISPAGRGKALAGDRRAAGRRMAIVLLVLLAVVSVLSLGTGASGTRLWPVLGQLLRGEEIAARDAIILFDIRLPRLALGILVGAALAVSGAVMQGLFRNPLADPGLVGVGAGGGSWRHRRDRSGCDAALGAARRAGILPRAGRCVSGRLADHDPALPDVDPSRANLRRGYAPGRDRHRRVGGRAVGHPDLHGQ